MSDLVSYINAAQDKIVAKGASKRDIDLAQSSLNLKFSKDYRELVRTFGCVLINGLTIFGVVDNPAYNVVKNTLEEKERYHDLPDGYYVLSSLGIEGILILQNKEGQVFEFSFGKELRLIYNSLFEFIKGDSLF